MTNESLYRIIEVVLTNKSEIVRLADYLDPAQLGQGIFALPEELINEGLRHRIEGLSPMLKTYSASFAEGEILLDAEAEVPKIGVVQLNYKLRINELSFGSAGHRLICTFSENAKAAGTVGQMALGALTLKGTLLQKAVGLAKLGNAVYVSGDSIAVDIDALDKNKKIPKELNLQYIDCAKGQLRLKYWLD